MKAAEKHPVTPIAIVLWLCFSVFLFFALEPSPWLDPNSVILADADKQIAVKTFPSRRLIIIGGSNASFNVNSKLVGSSLGANGVNMGLIAQIGLAYMLKEVEPYIRQGDLVVIVPEYQQFTSTGYETLVRLLINDPGNFRYINTYRQWLAMPSCIRRFMSLKGPYWLKVASTRIRNKLLKMLALENKDEVKPSSFFPTRASLKQMETYLNLY